MEKLRLCYVHNVPNNPVFIDVDSVKQAIGIKEVMQMSCLTCKRIIRFQTFQMSFGLKSLESDGWLEWTNEDGEPFDEVSELWN